MLSIEFSFYIEVNGMKNSWIECRGSTKRPMVYINSICILVCVVNRHFNNTTGKELFGI